MKAIVQERYGSPNGLALREIEKPFAGDDRVLVRVRAASVNASDWHLLRRLPHVIGRLLGMPRSRVRGGDFAGQVEAVGKRVTRFTPGDEVFGVGIGSFAEYTTTFEDRLAQKPRNLTFEQAAAIPGAGCTALQGLRDKAQVKPGQHVLIYGAGGGVGTFAVQIAKALGAHVTAVTSTGNLDLMRSIGADETLDYTKEDFSRRAERYDVVFDNGANRSYADCERVLVPNGTLVLCGAPNSMGAMLGRMLKGLVTLRTGSKRISFLARIRTPDLVALKEMVEAGKLSPVIDRQYPLSGVPDALRYLGTRQARGKLVISISPGSTGGTPTV
ncbi:MAG TPA: NAD(P)-dependent alcohol dehydrogenase [Gemmatimonadales bacterium]